MIDITAAANTTIYSIELSPRKKMPSDTPYENATLTNARMLSIAKYLAKGQQLGWQLETDSGKRKCTAFKSWDAEVTVKDLGWIFEKCASANSDPVSGDGTRFFAGRKVYRLISWDLAPEDETTGQEENKNEDPFDSLFDCNRGGRSRDDSSDSDDIEMFRAELLPVLTEAGGMLQMTAGVSEAGHDYTDFLISLPEPMSLRLRSVISKVFPYMVMTEMGDEGLGPDTEAAIHEIDFKRAMYLVLTELINETSRTAGDEVRRHTPLDELGLSVRSYNCLRRAGVESIEELKELSGDDLHVVRNLSKKNIDEIMRALAEWQPAPVESDRGGTDHMAELDRLIGLEDVKEQVRKIVAFAKMKESMKAAGRDVSIALNMCFVGNPGTAKTTTARILAGIFYEIGLTASDELIEVGRAELIGRYEGQTAQMVQEVFRRAKGKVLFIDEAYSLVEYWEGAYGDEAISTIVQEIENNREDTFVIFAGYPEKMEEFISRNPGLRSRVPFRIAFNDYSVEEMMKIVDSEAAQRGFTVSSAAEGLIREACTMAEGNPKAGNGRFCRNLVERAILEYASRVYGQGGAAGQSEAAGQAGAAAPDAPELTAEDFDGMEAIETDKKAAIGFRV